MPELRAEAGSLALEGNVDHISQPQKSTRRIGIFWSNSLKPNRNSVVYGARLSTRSLITEVIRYSAASQYDVFAVPHKVTLLLEETASLFGGSDKKFCIHSYHDLTDAANLTNIKIWYDPVGQFYIPAQLRKAHCSHVFPIVSVPHTFSYQYMLHEWVLPTLLSPSFPYDSIVCISKAAEVALRNLFQHVAEEFEREHGPRLHFNGRFDQIPLGVDTDLFRPREKQVLRQQFGLPLNATIILYLGRLSATCKMDLLPLFRVFKDLLDQFKQRELRCSPKFGQVSKV